MRNILGHIEISWKVYRLVSCQICAHFVLLDISRTGTLEQVTKMTISRGQCLSDVSSEIPINENRHKIRYVLY